MYLYKIKLNLFFQSGYNVWTLKFVKMVLFCFVFGFFVNEKSLLSCESIHFNGIYVFCMFHYYHILQNPKQLLSPHVCIQVLSVNTRAFIKTIV